MALSRRSVQRMSGSIWPGFVDAMTALLLVLVFVLSIFMILQFMLSQTITGQESELDELASEVNALARALGLEQQQSFSLEEQTAVLSATIKSTRERADAQSAVIAALTTQLETQSAELDQRAQTIAGFENQVSSFEAQVATLLSQRDQAQAQGQILTADNAELKTAKAALISQQEAMQLALASARSEIDEQIESARLAAARRQALDALMVDLRTRVSQSETSLAGAMLQLENSQNDAASLTTDLSQAVARLATERDVAAALQARLDGAQATLDENEIARIVDAAAAQVLRERLLNSDDELTAMTLALEEQRRKAEEVLTLLAAADAAKGNLNDKLLAALLEGETLQSEVDSARNTQANTGAQVDELETALAAAVLAQSQLSGQLAASEMALSEAVSRLGVAQDELGTSQLSQDGLQNVVDEQSQSNIRLTERLTAIELALAQLQAERDDLQAMLTNSRSSNTEISERLGVAEIALAAALVENQALNTGATDQNELQALLTAALAAKLAAELDAADQMSAADQRAVLLSAANTALNEEEAKSADSLRRMAVLNQQISALRGQIGSLQALLEVAESKDRDANIEITNLSSRLNTALARVLSEERARADLEAAERTRLESEAKQLENYRSEFFGKMRAILGDREGVQIVGDRFVFSSEVLFEPASADLAENGKTQITRVAAILAEVSSAIPPEIDWVIRVDGHTDNTALSGVGRYRDNWELSQARALSVVRFMIDELSFPATRLAATGFGEFQPVAKGDSPQELAQNRRIELKLTER